METEKILSRRQSEVLPLVIAGFSTKMIARELNIREGTVKVHLAAAFGKLGVRTEIVAACRQEASPDRQIRGCTAAITSGRWQGNGLAWAFYSSRSQAAVLRVPENGVRTLAAWCLGRGCKSR
jgi:DNA-binding CsgD family transcriptional regulator